MEIKMTTDEQKKLFVNTDEKLFVGYKEFQSNGTFELLVTNKRIYTKNQYENELQENIVAIETVEYVNYIQTKAESKKTSATLFGFFMALAGIIMLSLNALAEPLLLLGIVFLAVGAIVFISGLIRNRPKYINQLIIGTSGEAIKLTVQDLKPETVKKMQKDIFKAKESSVNI